MRWHAECDRGCYRSGPEPDHSGCICSNVHRLVLRIGKRRFERLNIDIYGIELRGAVLKFPDFGGKHRFFWD